MAAVAKSGVPSMCSVEPAPADLWVPGMAAGAAIGAGDVLELRSDNLIYPATVAAATKRRIGVAFRSCDIGENPTVVVGQRFNYGVGLSARVPKQVYVSTAGALDDAQVGSEPAVGFIYDDTRIQFYQRLD